VPGCCFGLSFGTFKSLLGGKVRIGDCGMETGIAYAAAGDGICPT